MKLTHMDPCVARCQAPFLETQQAQPRSGAQALGLLARGISLTSGSHARAALYGVLSSELAAFELALRLWQTT